MEVSFCYLLYRSECWANADFSIVSLKSEKRLERNKGLDTWI